MKAVKVLGPGCVSCKRTHKLIEEVARAQGVAISLEKVEDIARIVELGVMATPGVLVDGKLVHSGGVPSRAAVETWLAACKYD